MVGNTALIGSPYTDRKMAAEDKQGGEIEVRGVRINGRAAEDRMDDEEI